MNGNVFNIQRFCTGDGPGIRTTVFLKGCPLSCIWCHNPESQRMSPEIMFDEGKCISCKKCSTACSLHRFKGESHVYDRSECRVCGKCAELCYVGALEVCGSSMSVDDVIRQVTRDRIFYKNSGGGLTISGGEPMAQFEFTKALLEAAKKENLHTCIETCGFASFAKYRNIAPFTDIFLFDWKLTDPILHEKYTGVSNALIKENLIMLDSIGSKTILRCPIIPSVNDRKEHLIGIAELANSLKNVIAIDIEPYHPLGSGKADKLGREYPLANIGIPSQNDIDGWISYIAERTAVPVRKS